MEKTELVANNELTVMQAVWRKEAQDRGLSGEAKYLMRPKLW
jgi:hypothetical protein